MTDLDLRAGKLEQSCPDCGRWEAAGSYCSGCGRAMGAADHYPNGDLTRRAVARDKATEIASTRVKRLRGRPRAEVAATPDAPPFRTYPIKSLRRSGEALAGSSVPPGRADAEAGASPDLREPVNGTSASR